MRLAILSRSKSIPSTRRLLDEARARGHTVRVLSPTSVSLFLSATPVLLYGGRRLRTPEVVIPRIASSIATYGLAVVEQLAVRGAVVVNSATSISVSRNPVRCLYRLADAGLPIPATVLSRDLRELQTMVDKLGGVPVLLKLMAGSERRGVMLCESRQSLEAALEAVLGLGHNIVMQEYVREAQRDVRVFVVGGKALAAVSRRPRAGRLTRTLFRAAELEQCQLTDTLRHAAEKAARLLQLDVCAVDMLELKNEARPFELNASPALPDMERATGVNLARAIVQLAEERLETKLAGGA